MFCYSKLFPYFCSVKMWRDLDCLQPQKKMLNCNLFSAKTKSFQHPSVYLRSTRIVNYKSFIHRLWDIYFHQNRYQKVIQTK